MASAYSMPAVKIGDPVVWAHSKERINEGAAGFVTAVGNETVNLIFLPTDSRGGVPRDGVRHVGDPKNQRIESDAGVFDLSPFHKRVVAIEAALAKSSK